ncbi:hypothetical protein KEJ15_07445 [Candidatus Bathyarchaeota archaeon]|nr:hypothetical protein [Candidatus Bathyarchaeota archaeon]
MKFMSRFFHNKRAITPVLSNLLLTVVAVAAMAVATTATYVITTNLRENMSERLIIEDVWFDNTTGYIRVYMRNIGKVSIEVAAAYVNHTSRLFTSPFRLEIGKSGWLNITGGWSSAGLYHLNIVTARGTHVGGYYNAP